MTKTENLTPTHLRCGFGSCPSVHRLEDGRLLIVGEMGWSHFWPSGLRPADNEEVILIDPAILATLREEWVREAVEAERKAIKAQLGSEPCA
jgi:hypothetical protein